MKKWRSSSTKKPNKVGDLQQIQQVSLTRKQSVRIVSTRQEESLSQSTAIWEQLLAKKKVQVESISGNEGRIAQAWVNVRGGMRLLSVYSWHLEGWTPRNEALMEIVVKHLRTSWHPWLIACDANMCPEDSKKSLRFRSRHMFIKAPGEGVSTGRSNGPFDELNERTYDYVIASHGLQVKIKNMEVVEDFESRPHKAVIFLVERDKEFQVWRVQKVPKALPGFSGGKLPGTSKVAKKKRSRRKRGGR